MTTAGADDRHTSIHDDQVGTRYRMRIPENRRTRIAEVAAENNFFATGIFIQRYFDDRRTEYVPGITGRTSYGGTRLEWFIIFVAGKLLNRIERFPCG